MNTTINKQLLFDHFANQTSPLQKRQIEEWLEDEHHQELFYQWLVEWEHQAALYQPEVEGPLQRFVEHMATNTVPVSEPVVGDPSVLGLVRSWFSVRWVVAASVLFLLTFSAWLGRDWLLCQTYRTGFGETRTLQLTDGSRVVLNANSELDVPRFGFGQDTREVWLRGEAFFAVSHKVDNQKFVVNADKKFRVTVHGTEFTVYARPQGAKVALEEGKVAVNYTVGKETKEVTLKPGDLVTLDPQNRTKLKRKVETRKYSAWKEHRFVFDDMTLREFGDMLAETYGLTVEIPSDELARRTLVGSCHATSVDDLLETIGDLFHLTIERQQNRIILYRNFN
ncbi:FecR family protein [Larkinella bovis]|uniref:FecR family protein n=1 Tax=Larkinella bovis TaxID=683041 RepID=A0ABW0IG87_9BACT